MKRLACAATGLLVGALSMASDVSVQETLRTQWTAAYNTGDMQALGAMYAVDARLQQGYCPIVTGRAAIVEFWRGDLGEGTARTYLEIEDSLNLEDVIYMSGRYIVEISDAPSAAARRVGGTYTQIWRREAHTGWTIRRETWLNLACAEVVVEPPPPGSQASAEVATTI